MQALFCRTFSVIRSAYRQDGLAILCIQDLCHSAVDSAGAAEDADVAGSQVNGVDTGEVTDGEQEEEDGQGAKDHLGDAVVLQGADEHEQAEDAPEQQIEAQGGGVSGGDAVERTDPDQDQRPPEKAVGHKSGAAKGVAVAEFQDSGNDLGSAAQSQAHGDDDDGQRDDLRVVEIEQDGGHPKAQQPQRAWIDGIQFFSRHEVPPSMVWLCGSAPFPVGSEIVKNYTKNSAPTQSFFHIFVLSGDTHKKSCCFLRIFTTLHLPKNQNFSVLFSICIS